MTDNTRLGDRMKGYEAPTRAVLPRRTYSILRVDIRAAHSFLRYCERPFDAAFARDMNIVAEELCQEITGARLAYAQSDEISVLYTDFAANNTEPWFGGVAAKQVSIASSLATVVLNEHQKPPRGPRPLFDARVFTINDPVEVANYFLWRQRDATRNSISMAAQAHFPHSQLQGLNGDQMQELLFQERGINWSKYPEEFKRGRVTYRAVGPDERSWWESKPAPQFAAEPDNWLARKIPALPSLHTPAEVDA